MPGYVIANVDVHDPDGYRAYVDAVPATIQAFGGRYLARGGQTETLEGDWNPSRLVIVEFPTYEDAKAWHASAEYAPVLAIRQAHSTGQIVVTESL